MAKENRIWAALNVQQAPDLRRTCSPRKAHPLRADQTISRPDLRPAQFWPRAAPLHVIYAPESRFARLCHAAGKLLHIRRARRAYSPFNRCLRTCPPRVNVYMLRRYVSVFAAHKAVRTAHFPKQPLVALQKHPVLARAFSISSRPKVPAH